MSNDRSPASADDALTPAAGPASRHRLRLVVFAAAIAVAALAVTYVGALLVVGDDIPRGTTVAGVAIGGMDAATATQQLSDELADEAQDVEVSLGEQTKTVNAAKVGLSFDPAATVAAVPTRSWGPLRLVAQIGGQEVEPTVTVDDQRLGRVLQRLSRSVDDPARQGAVRYDGLDVVAVTPRAGMALDQTAAKTAVVDGYLTTTEPIVLPVEVVEPEVTAEQVTAVAEGQAVAAISAPVTLTADGVDLTLDPEEIADVLSFRSVGR